MLIVVNNASCVHAICHNRHHSMGAGEKPASLHLFVHTWSSCILDRRLYLHIPVLLHILPNIIMIANERVVLMSAVCFKYNYDAKRDMVVSSDAHNHTYVYPRIPLASTSREHH